MEEIAEAIMSAGLSTMPLVFFSFFPNSIPVLVMSNYFPHFSAYGSTSHQVCEFSNGEEYMEFFDVSPFPLFPSFRPFPISFFHPLSLQTLQNNGLEPHDPYSYYAHK